MELRVRHQELNDVANQMNNNRELLITEIQKLVKESDNLKNIWKGRDANSFYDKIDDYLKRMEQIPEIYDVMIKFITKADENYQNLDMEYANSLRRVVETNE